MKRIRNLALIVSAFMVGMLFFGVDAHAYIDPSVMTYVIQAIAGIVIAVGAVVGIYWRKAKKKAQDKLGIKENIIEESDDIIVNAETTNEE